MADQIRIRELTETTVIDDAAFLAVDYENETHKVSVENFNANANATAKRYAEQAAASATAAAGSATAASATSAEVDLKVTDAQGYATSAANSATNSRTYANSSQEYANAAAASANLADADADASAASATAAAESSVLSRSWAVGGTGTRTGEDTNNARYWSDVAAAAAGGGVTSFNGRGGAVTPQAGDYTAAMVGAAAASDVYTKSETYAKNEVYNTSQTYPRTTIDTMVADAEASGVTSFNNRTGAVTPSGSDYTAAIINGTDTNGVLGVSGRVYTIQALIDEITNRILNSLVTDSDLATALQSYVTKSMITTLATITNTGTKVLDGTEKNPSVSGSLAEQIKAITDDYLTSGDIYNGLDKTAAGFALDARQGKALNDSFTNSIATITNDIATLTALVTPSRKYFTNWNVTKWGHYCAVNWWSTGFPMNSDGVTVTGTIEQGFRPYNDVRNLTKVYNGSAYVDCVVSISTGGVVTIRDIGGSKIDGINTRYLQLNSIVYYVD